MYTKQRFGAPYTYCGCPLPGDTIGQKLSRLTRRFSSLSADKNGLIPPHRTDALSATHASEHNSVELTGHEATNQAQRKKREEKIRKRRERDEKNVRDGKMGADVLARGNAHDAAFLYPVPFVMYAPLSACVSVGAGAIGGFGGGFSSCAVVRPSTSRSRRLLNLCPVSEDL